jgi:hypothetical protein
MFVIYKCSKFTYVRNGLEYLSVSGFSMFADKARSLPKSGAPERFSAEIGSGPTQNFYTRLQKLAKDKHSSLFRTFVIYGRKKTGSTVRL